MVSISTLLLRLFFRFNLGVGIGGRVGSCGVEAAFSSLLDLVQITNNNGTHNVQIPPPPPPRDPKKRLYLSGHSNSSHQGAMDLRRPVSYSFENVSSSNQDSGHLHLNPTIVANDQNQLHHQLSHNLSNKIPPIAYNMPGSDYIVKHNPYNQQNDAPPLPQRRRVPSASPSSWSTVNYRSHSSENHKPRKSSTNPTMNKTKSSQNINSLYNQPDERSFTTNSQNHHTQFERKITNRPRSNPNFSNTISNHLVNPQNRSRSNLSNRITPTHSEKHHSAGEYWKSPPLPFVASRDFRLDYDDITTSPNATTILHNNHSNELEVFQFMKLSISENALSEELLKSVVVDLKVSMRDLSLSYSPFLDLAIIS